MIDTYYDKNVKAYIDDDGEFFIITNGCWWKISTEKAKSIASLLNVQINKKELEQLQVKD